MECPAALSLHVVQYIYTAVSSFQGESLFDSRILLARYVSITDYDVYEISVGANSNTLTWIRSGIGGLVLAQKATSNILHCTHSQWLWVDWSRRGIAVGTGPFVGDSVLLSVGTLPQQFDISAITVATGESADGFWEFATIPGLCTDICMFSLLTVLF